MGFIRIDRMLVQLHDNYSLLTKLSHKFAMINEHQEVAYQGDNLNDSFNKGRTEDDTLSLESDRSSQGYINEKVEDWPSWTVDDKQSEAVHVQTHIETKSQMVQESMKPKQEDKAVVIETPIVVPTVGAVNEQEIANLKAKQVKVPPRRYGRGMLRFKRLEQEKERKLVEAAKNNQQPKDIPTYNASNNNN